MFPILYALAIFVADVFKSRRRLEAENLFLRHQLNVALRQAPTRFRMRDIDRLFSVWMVRFWPNLVGVVQVVRPETVLRWHRTGFRAFWRWSHGIGQGDPRLIVPCAI
jgi:hypothetical protein